MSPELSNDLVGFRLRLGLLPLRCVFDEIAGFLIVLAFFFTVALFFLLGVIVSTPEVESAAKTSAAVALERVFILLRCCCLVVDVNDDGWVAPPTCYSTYYGHWLPCNQNERMAKDRAEPSRRKIIHLHCMA